MRETDDASDVNLGILESLGCQRHPARRDAYGGELVLQRLVAVALDGGGAGIGLENGVVDVRSEFGAGHVICLGWDEKSLFVLKLRPKTQGKFTSLDTGKKRYCPSLVLT